MFMQYYDCLWVNALAVRTYCRICKLEDDGTSIIMRLNIWLEMKNIMNDKKHNIVSCTPLYHVRDTAEYIRYFTDAMGAKLSTDESGDTAVEDCAVLTGDVYQLVFVRHVLSRSDHIVTFECRSAESIKEMLISKGYPAYSMQDSGQPLTVLCSVGEQLHVEYYEIGSTN
jgi:hypothetical protein